jgi:tetratricopeptide (TPR) repeat protein
MNRKVGLRFACAVVAAVLSVNAAALGEQDTLVVHVSDVQGAPVAGLEIGTQGPGGSDLTDRRGIARIKLPKGTAPNSSISLQIWSKPSGKDLVIISPWDNRVQVLPYENEAVNYAPVVVVNRGDRTLLESGDYIRAMLAKINQGSSSVGKTGNVTENQRQVVLAQVAQVYGLPPEEVDKAIRAWSERAKDPYDKGLAALYARNYPVATEKLRASIENRKGELSSAQSALVNAELFLGQSLRAQGNYREAVGAFEQADKYRPGDSSILNFLGSALQFAGEVDRGEAVLNKALTIAQASSNLIDQARASNGIGGILLEKNDLKGAEKNFRESLRIAQTSLGSNNPLITPILDGLGDVLREQGRFTEADNFLQQAIDLDSQAYGEESENLARDLVHRGSLLEAEGNYAVAENLLRRALTIEEKIFPPDHPDYATTCGNLGELLLNESGVKTNREEAEKLLRRALDIHTRQLGPNAVPVSDDLNNLATMYLDEGQYFNAEPLLIQASSIAVNTYGEESALNATIMASLAQVFWERCDYTHSETLYRRSLEIDAKLFGVDKNPGTLNPLRSLAYLRSIEGDILEAENLFFRAWMMVLQFWGPGHPTTLDVQAELVRADRFRLGLSNDRPGTIPANCQEPKH